MIKKIKLNTIPFNNGSQELTSLKRFNYFFGTNGSGKTTISKIIAHSDTYPSCNITWDNGVSLECLVYNRDFVDENFSQQSHVKGVFTLGKTEADTLQKIDETKSAIDLLQTDIGRLSAVLQGDDGRGGKKQELIQFEDTYAVRFWSSKEKHDKKLAGSKSGEGLRGVMNTKDNFKRKVLAETSNTFELLPVDDLEAKASTVFSDTLEQTDKIAQIQPEKLLSLETESIFAKKVIGKEDVDIAAMIRKLDNSGWVQQGLSYYEINEGICPFCQRKTDEQFAKSLREYFDESFEQDTAKISAVASDYTTESKRIQEKLQEIIDLQSIFVNSNKLEGEKKLLDTIITGNIQRLVQKKKDASQVIEIDSLQSSIDAIVQLINEANAKISERNMIVKNIANEKKILTGQIWRFIVEELKNDVADYTKQKQALSAAISSLESQVRQKTTEKEEKEKELRNLEKQTTTVLTTKDEINKLLFAFGFKSFKLDITSDGKAYKLIRENGDEAHKTLSDGERNFLTFLYFYHLLKGSQEETGLAKNKVVVFDDPISSLDNDILFIVSTLIRELIQNVRDEKETVKQVFVLTHNIYFHKEVTFNRARVNVSLKEESFWLVKKDGVNSIVELQSTNPIKTSYELLWDEVKNSSRNKATIQNTLRRILDNYFKLLGNIPLDNIYKDFAGDDKIKCKALLSWVNDGSHSAFDEDFYTPLDDGMIEKYLSVFKEIFEKSKHIAHYNMMMGITDGTEQTEGDQPQ